MPTRVRRPYAPRPDALIPGALCSTIRDPAHDAYCLGRVCRKVTEQKEVRATFPRTFLEAIFVIVASGAQEFNVRVEVRARELADLWEIGKRIADQVGRVGLGVNDYDYQDGLTGDLFSQKATVVVTTVARMQVHKVIDTCRRKDSDHLLIFSAPKSVAENPEPLWPSLACLKAMRLLLERVHRPEISAILPDSVRQFRVCVHPAFHTHCQVIADECGLTLQDGGTYGSRRM